MVLFIMPKGDKTVGSSRYRAYAMGEQLKTMGWKVHFAGPSMLPNRRLWYRLKCFLKDLGRILWFRPTVVLAQRCDRRREQLWLLRSCQKMHSKIIYDADDPVGLSNPITSWLLTNASAVFAGSHYLVELFSRFNKNVHLVPTSIDFKMYDPKLYKNHGASDNTIVIGWIGTGPGYLEALTRIAQALQRLPQTVTRQVKFRCIGTLGDPRISALFEQDHLDIQTELVENIDWKDERAIVAEIASFDIGLSPWRGDQGGVTFKTIQYMALGVVPIGEAAGENVYHIEHGKTGFLVEVRDISGWTHWIEHLVMMPSEEREKIGKAAHESAHERFSLARQALQVDKLLKGLL